MNQARDRVFSFMIRERDGYTCQRCGARYTRTSASSLHCAHMFGRGKISTRWDPQNACALCALCHGYLDTHPDAKRAFFMYRLGEPAFEALQVRSNNRSVG